MRCSKEINFSIILGIIFSCFFPSFVLSQDRGSSLCIEGEKLMSLSTKQDLPIQSIALIDSALVIFEKGNCWSSYVKGLNAKSRWSFFIRDYEACRLSTKASLEIASNYLGDSTSEYATSLANYAVLNETFGEYQQSIDLQLKSLEIENKLFGIDHHTAIAWETIGLSYQSIGDYDMALQYLEQANGVISTSYLKNKHEAARIMQEIGHCYLEKKQFDKALTFLETSLPILDNLPQEQFYEQTRWFLHLDAAEIHFLKQDFQQAHQQLTKALKIQQEFQLIDSYKTFLLLGDIYLAEHKYDEALIAFQNSEKVAREEFHAYTQHQGMAIPIAKQAEVFALNGNYKKSIALFDKAIKVLCIQNSDNTKTPNKYAIVYVHQPSAIQILGKKAEVIFQAFKANRSQVTYLKEALDIYKNLAQLIHQLRRDYIEEGSKHVLIRKASPVFLNAVEVAQELYQITKEEKYIHEAIYFTESNKAVLLYESIREATAKNIISIPDSLLKSEKELKLKIAILQKQIIEAQQKTDVTTYKVNHEHQKDLFNLKINHQKLIKHIKSKYPAYKDYLTKSEPKSIHEIRKYLNDDTAIAEFIISKDKGFVFFITNKKAISFELSELDLWPDKIKQFQTIISNAPKDNDSFKKDYLSYIELSDYFYRNLLKKGLSSLGNQIKHLIIIPDDILCYIPFENLIVDSPKSVDYDYSRLSYLLHNYYVSYQYSSSLIANPFFNKTRKESVNSFIGFAPSFVGSANELPQRNCSGNKLSNLRCNTDEVNRINDLLNGKKLIGSDASTSSFREIAKNYNIIHLATHACINAESPGMSKIFLSNNSLSQSELNTFQLNNELTVLSACNTGIGKRLEGEGVISMTRGFMLAGSRSVLASLWAVDDCTTSDLMFSFYTYLQEGMSKDEAITNAKKNFLANADQNNSHPYYWSAFVQFGNTQAIKPIKSKNWFLVGVSIFALFLFWLVTKTKVF